MRPYRPQVLPLKKIDWLSLLSLIGPASAAVARYDGMLQTMVNPEVMLSPMLTQEAVLSSRIEGSQATMQEVLEFEAEPKKEIEPSKRADFQEVINYRNAVRHAVTSLGNRPICLNLLK
ncbi:MAG: Fic family protein, partial [Deltaproteobacteria bacterium]|nr:Fic family protein [Deltaproteobacteria bacterium]